MWVSSARVGGHAELGAGADSTAQVARCHRAIRCQHSTANPATHMLVANAAAPLLIIVALQEPLRMQKAKDQILQLSAAVHC